MTNAKVSEILKKIGTSLPVDVEKVAKFLNIEIEKKDFEDDISGIIVMEKDAAIIGVNKNHSHARQRFTIAHEIGHFILHKQPAGVFVDSSPTLFRDKAGVGTKKEIEANNFAAELLMPKSILQEKVKLTKEWSDKNIELLANEFDVSTQALAIRLIKLNLVNAY